MNQGTKWEEQYKNTLERLPWDIGSPAPELQAAFDELALGGKVVLEIGCGTGTNAIWMAQQGCRVVATDISPTAIAAAKGKAKESSVNVDFKVADIVQACPVPLGSVNFAFDRGVFHVMEAEGRSLFVKRVAEALERGGFWLCLAGSKDEERKDGEEGPPQLKASEIADVVEPDFEIHKLSRFYFTLPSGARHLGWIVLMRKR
jgi:cyclopropane fatty-acyl-phospholipid synthase-like methyltransferase